MPLYTGNNGRNLLDYIIQLKSQLAQCQAQIETIKKWDQDGKPRL